LAALRKPDVESSDLLFAFSILSAHFQTRVGLNKFSLSKQKMETDSKYQFSVVPSQKSSQNATIQEIMSQPGQFYDVRSFPGLTIFRL